MANGTPGSDAPKRTAYIAVWIVEVALILVWSVIAIAVGSRIIQTGDLLPLWGIGSLIMVILLALAGREINGRWFGILIDTRNKISLSRLQITLWTIMVLSAYLTMAIPRVVAMVGPQATLNQAEALDIRFPEQLILAMGISAVSFAGANLINSNKKSKQVRIGAKTTPEAARARRDTAQGELKAAETTLLQVAQDETNKKQDFDDATAEVANATNDADRQLAEKKLAKPKTLYEAVVQDKKNATEDRDKKKKALEQAEEDLTAITEAQGLLHKNADPSEARWVDLFRGEEIGNYKLVEMAKVQMLFFTVVVVATYAAALSSMLRDMEALRKATSLSFPDFAPSLNALLGISHGTYLSVKTIDHSE